jgi:hypothetical protein
MSRVQRYGAAAGKAARGGNEALAAQNICADAKHGDRWVPADVLPVSVRDDSGRGPRGDWVEKFYDAAMFELPGADEQSGDALREMPRCVFFGLNSRENDKKTQRRFTRVVGAGPVYAEIVAF